MYKQFLGELEIPKPDYVAEKLPPNGASRLADMIKFIEQVLSIETPRLCVVMGDVDSTMAGAIAAKIKRIPVVHIEAGIRTKDRNNPEEINRRVSDTLSDILFTNCNSAKKNLLKEGYP